MNTDAERSDTGIPCSDADRDDTHTLSLGSETVIQSRGLTRRFGTRLAVDGLDLDVRRGEIFGFLGPNGSGKSTTLRMLLGLLHPSSGSIRVLGYPMPEDVERLRAHIGYMPQHFSLYDDLTVQENLEFVTAIFGLGRRTRRQRIEAVLTRSGLDAYRESLAGKLSGGWKQRLALVAATLHEPDLVVLDEPTAGVDPESRRELWERLFELTEQGVTVVVSTHYMDEAVRCHRICVLHEGRRVALGSPRTFTRSLRGRAVDVVTGEAQIVIQALRTSPLAASTTQLGETVHVLLTREAPRADVAAPQLERWLQRQGLRDANVRPGIPNLEDAFVALLRGEHLA